MKLSAKKIEHKNDKLIITDNKGASHVIDNIKEQEGLYMRTNWMFEDDVASQFNEHSQEDIIEALEQTTESDYFA